MATRLARTGLGLGLGVALAEPGVAVDWHLAASAALSQQFHSNIQLLPARYAPEAVFGTDLGLTAQLIAREPHWQVAPRVRLQNLFYTPIATIDTQNQYLDLDAHYATERSRVALTVAHTDDALLSSQSEALVGIVLTRVQRRETSLAPSWTFDWSERTRLTLGYSYQDLDYAARTGIAYASSTAHTASSGLEHRLSERLLLSGTLAYTAYRAEQRAIDYLNALAGLQYAVTETLSAGVSGGVQVSDSETQLQTLRLAGFQIVSLEPLRFAPVVVPETVTLRDRQLGPLVTATLRQRFDTSDWQLAYAHQISPSINGALFESDRVAVTASQRVSERLTASMNLSYTEQALPHLNGETAQQAYYRLGGELSYAVTEQWHLGASYQYTLRDLGARGGAFSGTQENHAVAVTLKYAFDPLPF